MTNQIPAEINVKTKILVQVKIPVAIFYKGFKDIKVFVSVNVLNR